MGEQTPKDFKFSALNVVHRPFVEEPRFDPHTATFDDINLRRQKKSLTPNALKSRRAWRAVVLREVTASGSADVNSWFSLAAIKDLFGSEQSTLLMYRVRIPELDPSPGFTDAPGGFAVDGPHQGRINNFYPLVVAESFDTPSAKEGDIVYVDFGDKINFLDGKYLGPVINRDPPRTGARPSNAIKNNPAACKAGKTATGGGAGGYPILAKPFKAAGKKEFVVGEAGRNTLLPDLNCSWEMYSKPSGADPITGFVFHETAGWTWRGLVMGGSTRYWKVTYNRKGRQLCGEGGNPPAGRTTFCHLGVTFSISAEIPKAKIRQHHDLSRRSNHAGLFNSWCYGVEVCNRQFPHFTSKNSKNQMKWAEKANIYPSQTDNEDILVGGWWGGPNYVCDAKCIAYNGLYNNGSVYIRSPSKSQLEAGYQLILYLGKTKGVKLVWPCVDWATEKKKGAGGFKYFPFGWLPDSYFTQPGVKARGGIWAHRHGGEGHNDGQLSCLYCYYRHVQKRDPNDAYESMKWTANEGSVGSRGVAGFGKLRGKTQKGRVTPGIKTPVPPWKTTTTPGGERNIPA